jgi:hypothetical protein
MGGPPIPEEVVSLARQHLAGIRPGAGRRWCAPAGRRVPGGWYFDYAAERLRPRRGPDVGFGFAPGYLVGDDGSVRTVGWHELRHVQGLEPPGSQRHV